jgi:uncharacterized alkaline shock family protein YloU
MNITSPVIAGAIHERSKSMSTATTASITTAPHDSTVTSESALGKTVVRDGVIEKIAGIAARDVTGVHDLGGSAARAMGALRNVVGNTDLNQGITVEVGEKQVAVDVSIVAEYPVPLQDVAEGVRMSVTAAIETLVGMQVTEVNVTVNDIHLPADDKQDDVQA